MLALVLAAAAAANAAPPREVLVFAAASLADALTEAGRAYEAKGGPRVVFNFAASNDLARQIEAGAPADLFVSANREQIDRAAGSGRVRPGEAFALLGNTLVVVMPRESPARSLAGPRDLLAFDRLAIADPEGVPAGVYAKTWLERAGLWEQLSSRVVPALDVRSALAAVAAGNVPAGVVYATDAASSDRVRIVYRVPADAAPEVRYWSAPVVEKGKAASPAAGFLAFLRGARARAIFARHGFTTLAAEPAPSPARKPAAAARPGAGG